MEIVPIRKNLLENNYCVVTEFIPKNEATYLHNIFKHDVYKFPEKFINDAQCPRSYAKHNYLPFVALLTDRVHWLNIAMGEAVLPTYSYARLYQRGEELKKHKDRGACELSITLNLGGDAWPFYINTPNGEEKEVIMKRGDAVIYKGCIAEHWRNRFEGDECCQVFLHYVPLKSENKIYYFDRPREET